MVRKLELVKDDNKYYCGKEIKEFLNEKSKRSERTARAYEGDINRFLLKLFNKNINNITSQELDTFSYSKFSDYVKHLKTEKLSNGTINRHICTIKELFSDLKSINILKEDVSYMKRLKPLKSDKKEIPTMPLEVYYEYLEEVKKEKKNSKEKELFMKLGVDQGIRLNALLNLTWRDFEPVEEGVVIKGLDKGNKKFQKAISHDIFKELLELKKDKNITDRVFYPLCDKNIIDMMIRFRKRLGYEDIGYSFHSLRKTAITFEYRRTGGDLIETQRFSGHSSLDMLQIYVDSLGVEVKGTLSSSNTDKEAYKKATKEELLEALSGISYDFIHVLNSKLAQNKKKNN